MELQKQNTGISSELREPARKADQYARASKAESTKRSYRSLWRTFEKWCEENNVQAIPCTNEQVTLFISDMAGGRKHKTLESYLAAISTAHRLKGYSSPCITRQEPLSSVWQGIKRTHGTGVRKVAPLMAADISKIMAYMDQAIQTADANDTLRLMRDKALLLIGFTGALRRSEVSRIEVKGIRYTEEGIVIHLMNTKGDKDNEGIEVPVAFQNTYCPVVAIKEWIKVSGIGSGYVFRKINRYGAIGAGKRPMSGQTVANIIKKYAAIVGINPDTVSGHSLRRGLATQLGRNKEPMHILMRHTRHKTERVARDYIEAGAQFSEDNPTLRLGL